MKKRTHASDSIAPPRLERNRNRLWLHCGELHSLDGPARMLSLGWSLPVACGAWFEPDLLEGVAQAVLTLEISHLVLFGHVECGSWGANRDRICRLDSTGVGGALERMQVAGRRLQEAKRSMVQRWQSVRSHSKLADPITSGDLILGAALYDEASERILHYQPEMLEFKFAS